MFRFFHLLLLASLFLGFVSTTALAAQDTIVRRAAFDIGSATIKCTVGDVDIATGTIVKRVVEFSRKIDFAEDKARSYDGNLSKDIMAKGLEALSELKQKCREYGAQEFSAVGGAAFRMARNGRAYFVTLKEKTGIPCRIISKQQASLLNYHAARTALKTSDRGLLVWDIGGDSLQMTARDTSGGMTFYVDELASVPFKNAVIETIQGHNINSVKSPNPMDEAQVRSALQYAYSHAEIHTPPPLASKIRSGIMNVVGIGGVHYYSIPETMGKREPIFTRKQIRATLKKWTGRSDEDFKSEYAATRLTNLILVLGYMDALNIKSISPLKINEADGLLVAPEFW